MGGFISSIFKSAINAINPFKSGKNLQNPYDLNMINDPINHLNYGYPYKLNQINQGLNRNEQIHLRNNLYED